MSDQPASPADPREAATAAQWLTGLAGGLWALRATSRILAGPPALTGISNVLLLVFLPLAQIAVIVWLRRCWQNAELLSPGAQRFSRGWTIGAWFVPVLNLWRPRRMVLDVWRASGLPRRSPVLGLWWAARLAAVTIAAAALAAFVLDLFPGFQQVGPYLEGMLELLSAIMLITAVRVITHRQVSVLFERPRSCTPTGDDPADEERPQEALPGEAVLPTDRLDAAPGRRHRLWWTSGTVLLAAVAIAGYVFQDDLPGLGVARYTPPPSFKGLTLNPDTLTQGLRRNSATSAANPNAFVTDYGGPAEGHISIIGYRHLEFLPSLNVNSVVRRMSSTSRGLHDAHPVDPGPRGGAMTCGTMPSIKWTPTVVCVWADTGTQGMFIESIPQTILTVDQVAQDARDFRTLTEHPA